MPEPIGQPKTPDHPEPPPIAAVTESMVEPIMVRTVQDTVQPSAQRETADIDADIKMTAGQRLINMLWELTQATLTIMVAGTVLYVSACLALSEKPDSSTSAILLLSNAFLIVIDQYFRRTNHQKVGGVERGDKGR